MLLDSNIPMDSLARYVCQLALSDKSPRIDNIGDVEMFIYNVKGEKEFETYTLAKEDYITSMSLANKLRLMRKNVMIDPEVIGYTLGAQYVSATIEKRLKIGQVDREIAEFRQMCGDDDATFQRFLKGYAAGIKASSPGQIPADIAAKYGGIKPPTATRPAATNHAPQPQATQQTEEPAEEQPAEEPAEEPSQETGLE